MKRSILSWGLPVLLCSLLSTIADAQRTNQGRRGGSRPPASSTTETKETTPVANPYGNIPIRVDSSGSGAGTESKPGKRPYNATAPTGSDERTPLTPEHLRKDDALFAQMVWRELDLDEKMNQTFNYNAELDKGSELFVNILMKAVTSGDVEAFADERFTTPLKAAEIENSLRGAWDTTKVVNPDDPGGIPKELLVTRADFDPQTVRRLRIREEWVFDKEAGRMFVRILAIAPLKTQLDSRTGKPRGFTPLFWVYYPDLRPTLAKREVYNPKNMGQSRMTWEELFETRMFSSFVVKSTFDNAANKPIRAYIKDPILALLEGDNVKEKIFNYEQDLWSY